MIGTTISHYKILEKLGEGGMGEVFLAHDTELERKVALKFLPPHVSMDLEALERFNREAKATAALQHPNIVTIHEIGAHENRHFIVMAYIEGSLLSDCIARGDLSIDQAVNITLMLSDALSDPSVNFLFEPAASAVRGQLHALGEPTGLLQAGNVHGMVRHPLTELLFV